MKTIALLTDFGNDDIYVGVMKGVMRGICEDAEFIDITHAIAPQHVREAAFGLMNAYAYFPAGTIFLVIVDPGVGSTRRPIAVKAGEYVFVAPDNGVLSYTLAQMGDYHAVELTNAAYHRDDVSQTFHGRDVFSPVAAHLAAGVMLDEIGTALDDIIHLPRPLLDVTPQAIKGEVLHIDRFGNVISSIGKLAWVDGKRMTLTPAFTPEAAGVQIQAADAEVWVNEQSVSTIQRAYSDVRRGELLALLGSSGHLEISVNQGNAAERLDLAVGDRIELKLERA